MKNVSLVFIYKKEKNNMYLTNASFTYKGKIISGKYKGLMLSELSNNDFFYNVIPYSDMYNRIKYYPVSFDSKYINSFNDLIIAYIISELLMPFKFGGQRDIYKINKNEQEIILDNAIKLSNTLINDLKNRLKDPLELSENYGIKSEFTKFSTKDIANEIKSHIEGSKDTIEDIISVLLYNQKRNDSYNKFIKHTLLVDGFNKDIFKNLIKIVSKIIKVPLYISENNENLEDILKGLLNKAKGNIQIAERGIVLFPDISIFCKNNYRKNKHIFKAFNNLVNGKSVSLNYNNLNYSFDTNNITVLGFKEFNNFKYHSYEDYVNIGIKKSILKRFTSFLRLNEKKDIKNVLFNYNTSPLLSIVKYCNSYGIKVLFNDDFIENLLYLSEYDIEKVKSNINNVKSKLTNIIYDSSIKSVIITSEFLNNTYTLKKTSN